MEGSQDSSNRSKQNKILRFAASVITTLTLAGSINTASANPIQKATPQELTSVPTQIQQTQPTTVQLSAISPWGIIPFIVAGGVVVFVPLFFGGLVVIGEREVGIVIKKFTISGRGLPAGRLIAMNGEAGLQADTLAPGWHWFYWPWQYSVKKEPVVVVPQGEIALIVAEDGTHTPPERILGKVVECDNFQDARKFLTNGGEKGRQMGFLTAGTYRINTALFKVITAANAGKHGMSPEQLRVYHVAGDKVGIVTTLDGLPIPGGEIAGPVIAAHDNFQNGQRFIDGGGRRGLQEQILLSGSWNLNPWFVQVEQVPMTEIPIGYVGVVISFVGKAHEDVSGAAFTHGNLVNPGHKGVWIEPLYPGKHPVNTRVMKIELVPTTNIVLNWSTRTERHNYDAKLDSLTVRSKDGFAFDLEIAQIIHVGALDAPKVISRVGSMQNLVDHVLEPTIGNYFRNSAQDYTVLDFLSARSERQAEAADYIRVALRAYDVQAIDTLIGDIQPPATLMQTQTDRKIAEEQRKTFEVQQQAQTQRQQLVRETALADIQQDMVKSEQGVKIAELKAQADIQQEAVKSEQGVKIAELKANAKVKETTGEAEAIRLRADAEAQSLRLKSLAEAEAIRATGNAKAEAYRAGVEALGSQGYTAMQLMQIIGDRHVRLIPDVLVGGNNGTSNSLVDGLLSMILWNQTTKPGEVISPLQAKSPVTEPQPVQPNGNSPVVVDFPLDGNALG
ncbi:MULTISPECIES: SPFH domain-containing protein [Fischerella]|uniref:Band 7 protein n=1 Tax=Fischerella muscicola CCMEE 5323 TaxID=2019572 RepID=A0A2N6K3I3_FISMU|nr:MULTISPECIES: flotillin family protein [Fischerella]MBD2431269.1 flotillin family protein [Fischerella sp. FACHB-380]PLZ89963.1 band 7 protein [Fischerella muscicola CCMEE 5323]